MPPPPTNQVPGTAQKTQSSVASSNLIPGQYIVVFKDQANGVIGEQAAQQAVQRTQAIFNNRWFNSPTLGSEKLIKEGMRKFLKIPSGGV